MILVPLLTFDLLGHRIGYGKGYYDRFLKLCRPTAQKIGISLFDPEDQLPAEDYDIKLTQVITPSQFYSFT
jgi:5-formyltetrahydrofolate cyclo-ligase